MCILCIIFVYTIQLEPLKIIHLLACWEGLQIQKCCSRDIPCGKCTCRPLGSKNSGLCCWDNFFHTLSHICLAVQRCTRHRSRCRNRITKIVAYKQIRIQYAICHAIGTQPTPSDLSPVDGIWRGTDIGVGWHLSLLQDWTQRIQPFIKGDRETILHIQSPILVT